jgi:excisionase family DNA binding protein
MTRRRTLRVRLCHLPAIEPDRPRLCQCPDALDPSLAARVLGISKSLCEEMIRQRQIPSLYFGRRIVVPKAGLARLLACEGWRAAGEPVAESSGDAASLTAANRGR